MVDRLKKMISNKKTTKRRRWIATLLIILMAVTMIPTSFAEEVSLQVDPNATGSTLTGATYDSGIYTVNAKQTLLPIINIYFNQELPTSGEKADADKNAITMKKGDISGDVIATDITLNSNYISIQPSSSKKLEENSMYIITIDQIFQAADGKVLAEPVTIKFTTKDLIISQSENTVGLYNEYKIPFNLDVWQSANPSPEEIESIASHINIMKTSTNELTLLPKENIKKGNSTKEIVITLPKLEENTQYKLKILKDFPYENGNKTVGDKEGYPFITKGEIKLNFCTLTDSAINVDLSPVVELEFNLPIYDGAQANPTNKIASNIQFKKVSDPYENSINVISNYSSPNKKIKIEPAQLLSKNTEYELIIRKNLREGNINNGSLFGEDRVVARFTTENQEPLGSKNNPILIKDAKDLYNIGKNPNWGRYYYKIDDTVNNPIDLTSLWNDVEVQSDKKLILGKNTWNAVGNNKPSTSGALAIGSGAYGGQFDGNGKIIENLIYKDAAIPRNFALFGAIGNEFTIKNLTISGAALGKENTPAGSVTGVLVADGRNGVTIDNCHVVGASISGGLSGVAALVGQSGTQNNSNGKGTTIINSSVNNVNISMVTNNTGAVGGIVGLDGGSTIINNCIVNNIVINGDKAGGVIGSAGTNSKISNTKILNGSIKGSSVGGFAGSVDNGASIENCYAFVNAEGTNVGEFTASTTGTYSNCYYYQGVLKGTVEQDKNIKQGYLITIDQSITGGKVFFDKPLVAKGDQIILNVTPNSGKRLKVIKANTEEIKLAANNSFVMPEKDIIITAEFETIPSDNNSGNNGGNGNSGGGSNSGSSGGSGSGGGTSVTGTTPSNSGSTTTLKPSTTVNGSNASASISTSDGDKIVEAAKKDKSDNVVLKPEIKTADQEKVTKIITTIPQNTVEKIGTDTKAKMTIETPLGKVIISNKGLSEIAKEKGNNVTISAEKNKDGSIHIDISTDSKKLTRINGGIKVSIPTEKTGNGIVGVLIDNDGKENIIKKSTLKEGSIAIPLDGSATVKIINNAKDFTDTEKHWAKDAIDFVSSRGLFSGTSENSFTPNVTMTRGMLVTVLHRLENEEKSNGEIFSDVSAGAYYSTAVSWASNKGIVSGTGNGGFSPDQSITREQLAVMVYQYAKLAGADVTNSATNSASQFTDSNQVSPWAKDAMNYVVNAGIVSGKSKGVLDPKGTATRAEVSAILERLIEKQQDK